LDTGQKPGGSGSRDKLRPCRCDRGLIVKQADGLGYNPNELSPGSEA
jgi:hypothetical protein